MWHQWRKQCGHCDLLLPVVTCALQGISGSCSCRCTLMYVWHAWWHGGVSCGLQALRCERRQVAAASRPTLCRQRASRRRCCAAALQGGMESAAAEQAPTRGSPWPPPLQGGRARGAEAGRRCPSAWRTARTPRCQRCCPPGCCGCSAAPGPALQGRWCSGRQGCQHHRITHWLPPWSLVTSVEVIWML